MRIHTVCPRGLLGKMALELVARETDRVSLKNNNFVYFKWLSFRSRKLFSTRQCRHLWTVVLSVVDAAASFSLYRTVNPELNA